MSTVSKTKIDDLVGQIHQGDCIERMQSMPDESVDLVFADPPFNIGYEYDEYDDRLESEQYVEWSRKWMSEVHRILVPNGAFWLAIGDEYAAELKLDAQKLGFHARSWVVWYYTFGVNCKAKFTRSHAHLFHFVKDPDQFTFNFDAIAVPSARQLVYGDKRANSRGRLPDDTWILRPQDCVDGFTADEDVWYFPRVAGTFKERAGFHGCQMPEQLMGRIIRACSNEDDLVLDPFAGSSTTVTVAKKLGRRYMGFELSSDYVELGMARLNAASVGDDLDGSPEPTVSAPSTHSPKARRSKNAPADQKGFVNLELAFDPDGENTESIVEAFGKTNLGYSVDRVIADPSLNEAFQSQCDALAVDGSRNERNRALFGLRKSGQFKKAGITTNKRTTLEWPEMDRFAYAVEIAWKTLTELYPSMNLDELLCDPDRAAHFDSVAASLAPGYSPLQYRWAALKLRKESKKIRKRLETRKDTKLSANSFPLFSLDQFQLQSVPTSPGVYVIRHGEDRYLFVGQTMNLRSRLSLQLNPEAIQAWPADVQDPAKIQIAFQVCGEDEIERYLRQMRVLKKFKTEWNRNDLFLD